MEYSHAMIPTKKINDVFINFELYLYLGLMEVCTYADVLVVLYFPDCQKFF